MEWSRIIDIIEAKTGKSVYKEVGCRSQYISDLRSGKSKNPGADFVLKLIDKFNLNPNWILNGEGEMFAQEQPRELPAERHKIPLLKPYINLSLGWDTEDNVEKYLEPFHVLEVQRGEIWAYRATGIAMIGLGIQDGDILFFGSQSLGNTDGIYIFALKGELYCRFLRFENLNMKIHIFSARQRDLRDAELLKTIEADDKDFMLLGKVIAWLHENTFVKNVR